MATIRDLLKSFFVKQPKVSTAHRQRLNVESLETREVPSTTGPLPTDSDEPLAIGADRAVIRVNEAEGRNDRLPQVQRVFNLETTNRVTVRGRLNQPNDVDFIKFSAVEGQKVTIDLIRQSSDRDFRIAFEAGSTDTNARIKLGDRKTNSRTDGHRITFTANHTGTYWLALFLPGTRVGGSLGNVNLGREDRNVKSGGYEVQFRATKPDAVTGDLVAHRLAPGGTVRLQPNWQERPVAEGVEATRGVGIRINGDDDNNNQIADYQEGGGGRSVAAEDDMVRLTIWANKLQSAGMEYTIRTDNPAVRLWQVGVDQLIKREAVPQGARGWLPVPDRFNFHAGPADSKARVHLDVEWASLEHGQATLRLVARNMATGEETNLDTVHVYSYRSKVILISGETQAMGGMGNANPQAETAPDRHGTTDIGIQLADQGYDVSYYTPDLLYFSNPTQVVIADVEQAVVQHGQQWLAFIGYSHGGGAVAQLAAQLSQQSWSGSAQLLLTGYIDAISNYNSFDPKPFAIRPRGSLYHINRYQLNDSFLAGIDTDRTNGPVDSVDVSNWQDGNGNLLNHYWIDNHEQIIHTYISETISRIPLFSTPAGQRPDLRSIPSLTDKPYLLRLHQSYLFSSTNFPDRAIRHRGFEAWLDQRDTSELFARDSGFIARPGLADPSLVSFESVNFPGRFLRHREMLLHLDANNGSDLYKLDATFRVVTGLNGTGVSFESVNFPGHFIRHEHFRLKIAANNGSELFRNDATFSATATILPVTYAPSTSAPTPPSVVTPPPSPAVTVRVPAPPATPVAANVWARAVDLNWGRVTNADWVKVFRSADGVNFAEVGAVRGDQTRFRVEGLRPGTIYWFRLQAVNQFGNSPFSDTVNLKTKREAPIAPSGLVAANVWATRVDLAWADRSDNESGFVVQLSTDGKIFREVGRTGANTTHFRVEQLRPNTRYWFRVLAINEIAASGSVEFMVTTRR